MIELMIPLEHLEPLLFENLTKLFFGKKSHELAYDEKCIWGAEGSTLLNLQFLLIQQKTQMQSPAYFLAISTKIQILRYIRKNIVIVYFEWTHLFDTGWVGSQRGPSAFTKLFPRKNIKEIEKILQ